MAALLVVAYHLQFGVGYRLTIETNTLIFRRGYLMVDLFFVLSGFVISYANKADRPEPYRIADIRRFFIGRIIRILPLHFFCLTYLALCALMIDGVLISVAGSSSVLHVGTIGALATQATLTNTLIPTAGGWNTPTWSISAEMFAYLVFPVAVLAVVRTPRLACAILLLAAASFFMWAGMDEGTLDRTTRIGILRCLAGFGLGMLVYYWRAVAERATAGLLSLVQIAAVAGVLAVLSGWLADPWIAPCAAILVGATWTDRGVLARLLSRRPLQFLGEISYSIYLNHVCLIVILGFFWTRMADRSVLDAATLRVLWITTIYVVTVGVSTITFLRVEKPARSWLAKRWLHRRVAPIESAPAAP